MEIKVLLMNFRILLIPVLFIFIGCKNQAEHRQQARKPSFQKTHRQKKADTNAQVSDSIRVMPVEHASFALQLNGKTIYVDPVGDPKAYRDLPKPDLVLITHKHPDHLSPSTLKAVTSKVTPIITPQSVKDDLRGRLKAETHVLEIHHDTTWYGIKIKAIPAYNLRKKAQKFHPKSRKDNGYVLSARGRRVYISGDTEDIPAMRHLRDIDVAFVCMNLPYTMTIDQAVDAVSAFQPKKVYPYHYRGTKGFSDIGKFKKEITRQNPAIEVELLNWYPDARP